jgi:hypothetical protein
MHGDIHSENQVPLETVLDGVARPNAISAESPLCTFSSKRTLMEVQTINLQTIVFIQLLNPNGARGMRERGSL